MLQLRQSVFVVEQKCWYLDADGVDKQSLHLLGRLPSGQLACYLRIVPPGHKFNGRQLAASSWTTACAVTGSARRS